MIKKVFTPLLGITILMEGFSVKKKRLTLSTASHPLPSPRE